MPWWEMFKGILPEKLFHIDARQIHITNSQITSGNHTVTDPKIIDKAFEAIAKANATTDTLPFQLVHKELVDDYTTYENISIKEKESLAQLRLVLDTSELECVLMARRVVLAYEQNNEQLASQLQAQLERNFPKIGKRVLNLMNTRYFDEMIIPSIESYRKEYGETRYVAEFRKKYNEYLHFFPLAIFVGNTYTKEHIETALIRRLAIKDSPFVRLHTIGEGTNNKIQSVLKKLDIESTHIIKQESVRNPNNYRAYTYEIKPIRKTAPKSAASA